MLNGIESHGKSFYELKDIDSKCYSSNYYDVNVNNYGVEMWRKNKCGTLLRFWENNGWIESIDPYGQFQWYFIYWLGRRQYNDERSICRQKDIVNRFKDKRVKSIKDVNGRFDDFLISPRLNEFCCIGV